MTRRQRIYTALLQTAAATVLLLLTPLMIYAFTRNLDEALKSLFNIIPATVISFIIFMINYWILVPLFFYKNRKIIYFALNIALYLLIMTWSVLIWVKNVGDPGTNVIIFSMTFFLTLMFLGGSAALALALRNSQRAKLLREQIMEEKRRHAEAELIWLKNQLNPHFLFNTLNNISALVAIDADRAQDCISRLSDLLRYAMYESSRESVPLEAEIDFLRDYISLMSLRCNNKTLINTNFEVDSKGVSIAPLLLVSLIENAFKHGISSNRQSEISISLAEKDRGLTFDCVNTNHAKGEADRSGSGIGLANMRRRLDILYGGRYDWIQNVDENRFAITIKIQL